MNPVKIGLLGLGTVGGGTLNVLVRNAAEISRRAGRDIVVSHAAARAYDPAGLDGLDKVEVCDDAFAVVNNPEVDIVVELIGGYSPARELVLKAIENGKHVVTANKALIAMHGNEIFEAAQKKGVTVAFEAAVAGGIPIIKALREGLAANHIDWIAGIINGTGNFILTEMKDKGRDFADVLAEAQALGYAEADPTFDVEGIDAAHKLTILASLAFGIPLQFDRCYTEGISRIEPQDVEYAEQFGYRIKHLGVTRRTEKGIELRVHPTLIPERRLIANVDGVMNAVLVHGDAVGPDAVLRCRRRFAADRIGRGGRRDRCGACADHGSGQSRPAPGLPAGRTVGYAGAVDGRRGDRLLPADDGRGPPRGARGRVRYPERARHQYRGDAAEGTGRRRDPGPAGDAHAGGAGIADECRAARDRGARFRGGRGHPHPRRTAQLIV